MAIRLGVLGMPQQTDWASLRSLATEVERLGYYSLWTSDHLYPIGGDRSGGVFDGWLTLAAWAELTTRVRLGLMVGANTLRHPAIVSKMATTLDHTSDGRFVLGMGAGWFRDEHDDFGIEFGSGPGERLEWLDESVAIVRALTTGGQSDPGPRYGPITGTMSPSPIDQRIPILIGGGGERRTLAIVARFADAWNVRGDLATVTRKDRALRRWCTEFGRDQAMIERTLMGGRVFIRDTERAAREVAVAFDARHGPAANVPTLVGDPGAIAAHFDGFVGLGFRHLYFDVGFPWDEETIRRLITEVGPEIEARSRGSVGSVDPPGSVTPPG